MTGIDELARALAALDAVLERARDDALADPTS